MLHILWLIIKIILLILLGILGLVLLLLLTILFVPVRYRAKGNKTQDSLYGTVGVSWILHAISVNYSYDGTEGKMSIKIFGIPLEKYKKFAGSFHKKSESDFPEDEEEQEAIKNLEEELAGDSASKESKTDAHAACDPTTEEKEDTTLPGLPENSSKEVLPLEKMEEREPSKSARHFFSGIGAFLKKIFCTVKRVISFVIRIPDRIGRMVKKLFAFFEKAENKKEAFLALWNDERIRSTIALLWNDTKKLLKHISPRKVSGQIVFGMNDPALTGQILGFLGATGGIHKYAITVKPRFEEEILEGYAACKGRIYGFMLIYIAIHIYFNKNFKYCMKLFRKKEDS